MKEKVINPLFMENHNQYKIEAAYHPDLESNLQKAFIRTIEGKIIPCMVNFEDRICLPVKKI